MLNYYRAIYGLNGHMKVLEKEASDLEGLNIYAVLPYDVGFVEINASTETQIRDLDKMFASRIIKFCEKQEIEEHFLGPLEAF